MLAANIVMKRAPIAKRDAQQRALGRFCRLTNCLGHFTRLAMTEAYATFLIANDDQRGEAKPSAALDDLGDPVDVDKLVDKLVVAIVPAPVAAATLTLL